MLDLLLIWVLLSGCLIVFVLGWSHKAGALTVAYFFSLSLIHVPGILAFLDGAAGLSDEAQTRLGFEITLIGMAAFIAGAVLSRNIGRRPVMLDAPSQLKAAHEFENIGWRVLAIGAAAYLFLIPVASFIPSITSLVAAFATLLVIGLWSQLYGATVMEKQSRLFRTLTIIAVFPLVSLVSAGFIGHGVSWALSVLAFLFLLIRRRLYFYLAVPVVLYLGLSLFVTYMGLRGDIRGVVWNEQRSVAERIEQVSTLGTKFEFLDLTSYKHRAELDARLNQNFLVGMGVRRHLDGLSDLVYGDTVPWWAFIPRAIWPDKPEIGGGGTLVASFTRIKFDLNTSIGVGQVLEFYMNFGLPGVIFGFMGLGYVLMRLDQGIMCALAEGDVRGLLLRAMPGLAILQPGGNLLEIFVGVISAVVAAYLLFHFYFSRAFPHKDDSIGAVQLQPERSVVRGG